MKQVDALYFIEHPGRELDIACAVKHLAQSRFGVGIEVVSLVVDLDSTLRRFRSDLHLVPYFYSAADSGVSRLLRQRQGGAAYVNLAFEQLLSKGNKRFKCPRDVTTRRHVMHAVAGTFSRDYLCEHGVLSENVRIVGSLACELYREPYRVFFDGHRHAFANQFGLDESKPWILFPENYGAAYFCDHEIEQRIQSGARPDETYGYRDFARKSLHETMRWLHNSGAPHTAEIIVRPRPAIRREVLVDAYRQSNGESPEGRIHFIKDASVREWILASDVVVSSYSTSLIEAAVAKKPTYMLCPIPIPDFLHSDWHQEVPHVVTCDRFRELTEHADELGPSEALERWAKDNFLAEGDAISNLVELVGNAFQDKSSLPLPPPTDHSTPTAREAWRSIRQGFKQRWRKAMTGIVKDALPLEQKGDVFSREEVIRRTQRWADVLSDDGTSNAKEQAA